MDERSNSTEESAAGKTGTGHEVLLNLRRSQAVFLRQVSQASGLEPSEVCRRLIGSALKPEAERHSGPLFSSSVQESLRSLSHAPSNGSWGKVPVYLDDTHLDGLSALPGDAEASNSGKLRHLLTDYMGAMERRPVTRSSGSRSSRKTRSYTRVVAGLAGICAVALLAFFFALNRGSSIELGPHWAGNETTITFDHHTHTNHSDGKLAAPELVALAAEGGCDALVVSDHSDTKGTVSDEQLIELQALREAYPDLILFNGIELNMPSYGGREHAGLIADPSVEAATLQQLRDLAERDLRRAKNSGAASTSDMQLIQMIADYQSLQNGMLLVYNHPSRKDASLLENLADIKKWNARSPVFTAFEGAPGHQNAKVVGSYKEPYLTEDHWDRVVSEVGGVWDQLLSEGHQIWGALASSDYHNPRKDKGPCAFSRTHLVAPEHSHRGVLKALKAGTFWADHGRILDQLWLRADLEDLDEPAYPGFVVKVGNPDGVAVVSLSIKRGPGSVDRPLTGEIIGNCYSGKTEILAAQEMAPSVSTLSALVPLAQTGLDGASCTLRARVRLSNASSADYMAYTNPIRFILN